MPVASSVFSRAGYKLLCKLFLFSSQFSTDKSQSNNRIPTMEYGINTMLIPLLATAYLMAVYAMLRVAEIQTRK